MSRRSKSTEPAVAGVIGPPVKTGITLSAVAHKRLSTASLVEGQTYSQLVEDLINTHMTHYFSGKRAKAESAEAEEAA